MVDFIGSLGIMKGLDESNEECFLRWFGRTEKMEVSEILEKERVGCWAMRVVYDRNERWEFEQGNV